jgi:hypothetical protein
MLVTAMRSKGFPAPVIYPAALRRWASSLVGEVTKSAGHVDGGWVGVAVLGDVLAARDHQFVGGAGVPADPDSRFGEVRFGQQGDIGDEGAQ